MTAAVIDADQHIFEPRTMWRDHIDPGMRDDALRIEDDDRGWPWLLWRDRPLYPVEFQQPGRPHDVGTARLAYEAGAPPAMRYDDVVPPSYTDAAARVAMLDECGLDAAVLFPNFGLVWEEMFGDDVGALLANMRAVNRWQADNARAGAGRLFPVAQITLRDVDWVVDELARLGRDGIRAAMLAPAPVEGRPLSHPDFDSVWAACCDHGVSPVFHVGGFRPPLDPAWYCSDPEPVDRLISSVFLWVAPAVAIADFTLNGTFERFPDLRIGVVELTCGWLPSFLLTIDGASDFYTARHGRPLVPLARRPSEYIVDHVRVAALAYEQPARIARHVPSVLMMGSDWPHAEGIARPRADYEPALAGLEPGERAAVLGGNAGWLLRL